MKTQLMSVIILLLTDFGLSNCLGQVLTPNVPDVTLPKLDHVHDVVGQAASRLEKVLGAGTGEARGLAGRVQHALKLPVPEKAAAQTLRQKLTEKLRMSRVSTSLDSARITDSFDGYELDSNAFSRRLRLRQLQADDARTAPHLARLWHLADTLGLVPERQKYGSEWVAASLAEVKRQPEDASVRARLADALLHGGDDRSAAASEAAKALALDKKHCLARLLRLQIDGLDWRDVIAGSVTHVVPLNHEAFLNHLLRRPLTDAEMARFEKDAADLKTRWRSLMSEAAAASDLAVLLRSLASHHWVGDKVAAARAAASRNVSKNIQAITVRARVDNPALFPGTATLKSALSLAMMRQDVEACGAILLVWLKERVVQNLLGSAGTKPDPAKNTTATIQGKDSTSGNVEETRRLVDLDLGAQYRAIIDRTLDVLQQRLGKASGTEAARIHEVLFRAEQLGVMGGRFQLDVTHLIESFRLDPARPILWNSLINFNEAAWNDKALRYAWTEVLLAFDPGKETSQMCAGAAVSMQDWSRAEALLEECLSSFPENFAFWTQKAVLILHRDTSDAALSEAGALFEKIKTLPSFETADFHDSDRVLFVRNYILFLAMQGRWDESTTIVESYQQKGFMPQQDAEELIEILRRLQPPAKK